MIRRDRPRQLPTACYIGPTLTSYDARTSPCHFQQNGSTKAGNNCSSKHYEKNKTRQPKNKVLLKLWSASQIVIASDETTAQSESSQSATPLDEFTLSTRTFEASFADGSKVFFRRDCFHRLLTVSSGSSVVIDDAPCLQNKALSSMTTPGVASSLSAAFSSCNGTGLVWLSPEARVIYAKALEILSHCEKLEKTLIQLIAENRHLKLPFTIGRFGQTRQKPVQQQSISQSIGTLSSYRHGQSEAVHPFHAFSCPYCSCYSAVTKNYPHAPNSKLGSISFLDEQLSANTVEPGAVIEVGSISKDLSSSGIASKSVSPPNFNNRDAPLRKTDPVSVIIASPKANNDGSVEASCYNQQCRCQKAVVVDTDSVVNDENFRPTNDTTTCKAIPAKNVKLKADRPKISPPSKDVKRGTPLNIGNQRHCKSAVCTQCLGDAIGKLHISTKRESSFAMKSGHHGKAIATSRVNSKLSKIEAEPPMYKIAPNVKRHHHHHHGGVKRKTGQNSRHSETSIHQSSIVIRSSATKKTIADQKYEYTCTPVSRCREKTSRKSALPVRLVSNNDAKTEQREQKQAPIDTKIVEILEFGESSDSDV